MESVLDAPESASTSEMERASFDFADPDDEILAASFRIASMVKVFPHGRTRGAFASVARGSKKNWSWTLESKLF